jgi:hypothetical protein
MWEAATQWGDQSDLATMIQSQGGGQNVAGGGDFWSGGMQALTALGLGYIGRRADVDIQRRMGKGGQPEVLGTQTPIVTPTGPTQSMAQQRVSAVGPSMTMPLMLLGVAVVAVVLLRK